MRFLDAALFAPAKLLFAPSKHLDRFGGLVDSGKICNYINQPYTRGLALMTAFSAAAEKLQTGDPDLAKHLITAMGVMVVTELYDSLVKKLGNRRHLLESLEYSRKTYFFDTAPQQREFIPPDIELDLQIIEEDARKETIIRGGLTLAGIVLWYSSDMEISYVAQLLTYLFFSGGASEYWRCRRALNGEWGVLTAKPEKEWEPSGELTPAPIPIQR